MNPRLFLALFLLGFSSGMPLNIIRGVTSQAWFVGNNVDKGTIGLFGLVGIPFCLKFLWSPFMDRFAPPFFGRRKGWVALAQALLVVGTASLAFLGPRENLMFIAVLLFVLSIVSASQDIAFDAWRVEALDDSNRGLGTSTAVLGYRIAGLVTGALALVFVERLGWRAIWLALAGLQLSMMVATIFAPNPPSDRKGPPSLRESVVEPFVEFFRSRSIGGAFASLGFVILFKWGVYLVASSSTTFFKEMGFSLADIGKISAGIGTVALLLGTVCGGLVVTKISVRVALLVFGTLQGACGLLFWMVAVNDSSTWMMACAVVSENFFVGMGSAALLTWMTQEADARYSITQFALLSSLMSIGNIVLTSPWGFLQKAVGWENFYLLTLVACVPGLLLLVLTGQGRKKVPNLPSA